MDFTTLKRRIETGAVTDVPALVTDLTLIFENAMLYNGKGSDYYRMANTLKEIVRVQHGLYTRWRQEHGGELGVATAPGGAAAGVPEEAAVPMEEEAKEEADAGDADADAPSGAGGGDASGARPRRGGRRGARA